MADKAQRQKLRNYYGIRNTRSEKLKELIPNLSSLTKRKFITAYKNYISWKATRDITLPSMPYYF